MKIAINKILSRINGIDTPIGGVSWTPPVDQQDIIRGLIIFLEDRRVLYNEYLDESKMAAKNSVEMMRTELGSTLAKLPAASAAAPILRSLRGACRKYLKDAYDRHNQSYDTTPTYQFYQSLGALRAAFGLGIARLCVMFDVEPEEEITSIFPFADDTAENEKA